MIESVAHAKNGLRELGLCGEGEWHAKEVVENFDLNRSRSNVGKDDGGRNCHGGGEQLVVTSGSKFNSWS